MPALMLPQLMLQNPFGPFAVPKRMIWTSSSIKMFRKCRRKWFWRYIMRLGPKYRDKNLMIGGAFHNCLGEWYKGKRADMKKIAARYTKQLKDEAERTAAYFDEEELEKLHSAIETFHGMMIGYSQCYEGDRAAWSIDRASIEAEFLLDMGEFDYAGKIDLAAGRPGSKGRFLVEHKTASSIRDSYADRLPLDTQIRGYTVGAVKGLKIEGVDRVLYDVVQKCKLRRKSNETADDFNARVATAYMSEPDKYFYREELTFSKDDLNAFEHEVRQTHQEFKFIVGEGMKEPAALKALLGMTHADPKDPRTWTPNDGACDDYFRTCEYFGLCTQGLDRGTGTGYEQRDSLHEELSIGADD